MSTRLPYLFVGVAAVLYFLPFLSVLSRSVDEGAFAMGAVRVMQGQVPYRDFFEVIGPGTFYSLAIFFKSLGATWLATRIYLLISTVGITLVMLYLVRRLRPGMEAVPIIFFVAVSFDNWNAVSHHMDATLFGLLSFAAFANWTGRPRPAMLFLAGMGAGLTTWFMLTKGTLLFLAFLVLVWTLYRRQSLVPRLLALAGGYFLAISAGLTWFWRAGALRDLIYANLVWPFANYSGINAVPYGMGLRRQYFDGFRLALRTLSPPAVAAAVSGCLSIPFLVVAGLPIILAMLYFRDPKLALDRETLPYWIAGAALYCSELHRPDMTHLVFGCPVLLILCFFLYRQMLGGWAKWIGQFIIACTAALALINPLVAMAAQRVTVTPRGSIRTAKYDPVLQFLRDNTRPGQSIYVYPYAPQYYFLSATTNPTRYSVLLYHFNTPEQFREAVHSLELDPVRYVIWDRSFQQWASLMLPAYRMPAPAELIMEPYLLSHYHVIGRTDQRFQFWERVAPQKKETDGPLKFANGK